MCIILKCQPISSLLTPPFSDTRTLCTFNKATFQKITHRSQVRNSRFSHVPVVPGRGECQTNWQNKIIADENIINTYSHWFISIYFPLWDCALRKQQWKLDQFSPAYRQSREGVECMWNRENCVGNEHCMFEAINKLSNVYMLKNTARVSDCRNITSQFVMISG